MNIMSDFENEGLRNSRCERSGRRGPRREEEVESAVDSRRPYPPYPSHCCPYPYPYPPYFGTGGANAQEPGRAILKCGSVGNVGPLTPTTTFTTPIRVASVAIDTSRLCNPKLLLTFTAQLNLAANTGALLVFTVRKVNPFGVSQTIGCTYTFSTPTFVAAGALGAQTFSFQCCECEVCGPCATYEVVLDTGSLIVTAGGAATPASVTISNAKLTALAVEDKGCSC